VTTEFQQNEDRISLTCVLNDNSSVIIWLAQRLLRKLVPALLNTADKELQLGVQSHSSTWNVKNDPARTSQNSIQSVNTTNQVASWLMVSVDVSKMPQGVRLTFKGANGEQVAWFLPYWQLRQWFDILYRCCTKAEWPLDVWKEWQRILSFESETSSTLWN
jgi:hypothetical protein